MPTLVETYRPWNSGSTRLQKSLYTHGDKDRVRSDLKSVSQSTLQTVDPKKRSVASYLKKLAPTRPPLPGLAKKKKAPLSWTLKSYERDEVAGEKMPLKAPPGMSVRKIH